jgi:hypothetical protein
MSALIGLLIRSRRQSVQAVVVVGQAIILAVGALMTNQIARLHNREIRASHLENTAGMCDLAVGVRNIGSHSSLARQFLGIRARI